MLTPIDTFMGSASTELEVGVLLQHQFIETLTGKLNPELNDRLPTFFLYFFRK